MRSTPQNTPIRAQNAMTRFPSAFCGLSPLYPKKCETGRGSHRHGGRGRSGLSRPSISRCQRVKSILRWEDCEECPRAAPRSLVMFPVIFLSFSRFTSPSPNGFVVLWAMAPGTCIGTAETVRRPRGRKKIEESESKTQPPSMYCSET